MRNLRYLNGKRKKLTICLMAISSDFLEIVLPNPVASGADDLIGFFIPYSGE